MNRILATLTAGLVAAAASPAFAQYKGLTFTNESGWTTRLYGQINLTYQGVDDSVETYNNFVNNGNSTSRVGIWVEQPTGQGNRFRFNFETALGIQGTAVTNQLTSPPWINWERTDIRKLEVAYSGNFGTIWAGQGSMSADSIAEYDISGTSIIGYSAPADSAGSFLFRAATGALTPVAIGAVFRNFDGNRRMRIRYDTPEFAGFTFSASYGQNVLVSADNADYYEAAIRYGLDNDVVEFDAGIGYTWRMPEVGLDEEHLIGSGTLLHKPTGLSVTFAAGQNQETDASYYYSKLGWLGRPFEIGATAVSIDYYEGSDFLFSQNKSQSWGIGAVQHIEVWHMEAYASYRLYSLTGELANYQDIDVVLVGARWRF